MYSSDSRGMPRAAIAFALAILPVVAAQAQAHDHGEEHERFEFSHPLVTESPSPDTKIRVDLLARGRPDATTSDGTVRVEGEYAFRPWISLALTVPYQWRSTGPSRSSGVVASELALKLADFDFADHGILFGGGLEMGLPTGTGEQEVGPPHSIDLGPFADVAMMRGPMELVAFLGYTTSTRAAAGEPMERQASANLSSLYHLSGRAEALLELDTEHALSGPDQGSQFTYLSPGMKVVPFRDRSIMLGASLRLPVSAAREFQHELLVTAMYHF